ncbi:MAG: hypothetical protein WB660_07760 [Candidatus Sulfotelmatobacter sp.]
MLLPKKFSASPAGIPASEKELNAQLNGEAACLEKSVCALREQNRDRFFIVRIYYGDLLFADG